MAELRFKVKADYEELGKLRAEIQKLKADLKSTGRNTDSDAVKAMESQLAMLTKQYEAMTKRIAEAEAQYDALAKKMTERARDIARAQDTISEAAVNPPAAPAEAPATGTSLETQAKAYEELKKEIDAIAGSKTNLIKQMLDEQNAIRLINAELKQINVEQKTNGKQTQAQKERVTQLNDSLLTHKQALSEVRQSLSNYVKLENAASGSMNELSQSLGRMRMVYRDLSEEERNSPFGNELLASIQQADAKIKELDATIGNHQRNVGNYGQAWNGLGNSIQQLARELPALANGPRVFFSAISNNLPILADEIKRARTEYDEMVKKGEKGIPVWKQIGASILSWQTALTVGITLLTMYGDKIVEWGRGLFEGSKALNDAGAATRELGKAMEEGSENAAREVVQLKMLEKIATDVSRSDDERNKAARKVLETLGETVNATNLAKVANGEYATIIDTTTKSLIKRAQAEAAMAKMQDKYAKVIRAQNKVAKREAKGDKATAGDFFTATWNNTLALFGIGDREWLSTANAQLVKRQQKAEKLQEEYNEWAEEFIDNFEFEDLFGKTPDADLKNYLSESIAEIARITQMEADAMRDRARSAKDMEFTVEQARIDAMKEGYQRDKAQRELNFRQELEQLERQKDDYIRQVVEQEKAIFEARENQRAKESKEYVKQTFDTEAATKRVTETDPVVQQYTQVVEYTVKKQETETARQDAAAWRDSMNAYLREYGDYEGKKLAITQEYEAKIADAVNVWDKAALSQKMKEELAELDIEANKTTNAIAQLFGDMRDKSVKELDTIAEKGTEALEFLKGGKWDSSKGQELGITKETFEIWSKSPEKLKAIADALLGVQQTSDQLRTPFDKVVTGFKELFNAAGDKNKISEAFAVIQQGVNELTGAIGFASDALSDMAEATGSKWMEKASEGIDSAMNVVNQTMAGADAGKAFGPWGMAIGAAVGLASSLVTEITKAKDAMHDVEIERLAKENETLEKSYDALGKSIEKAFSADASNLIEQQNTLLKQKKTNLELMIAEEQAKKKVDTSQVDALKEQLDEIDEAIQSNEEAAVEAIAGQSIMSAIDSLASAYADAWANGEDAASASVKATRNMLRTSLTEFLKGQLTDEVTAFNEKLAEVMRDGIMEPWEEKQLDELRDKMDKEAQKYYEQTSKYWEGEKEEEKQQQASSKGYQTLSEDTGNELVGRALAQYESNLRMEATMAETRDEVRNLMEIKPVIGAMRDIAAESRTLIADSYLELQQIRENTGAIIKPIKNLSDKIDRWDNKIMGL